MKYKSKYNWCKNELEKVHSLKSDKAFWADDEEIIPPKKQLEVVLIAIKNYLAKSKTFVSLK